MNIALMLIHSNQWEGRGDRKAAMELLEVTILWFLVTVRQISVLEGLAVLHQEFTVLGFADTLESIQLPLMGFTHQSMNHFHIISHSHEALQFVKKGFALQFQLLLNANYKMLNY